MDDTASSQSNVTLIAPLASRLPAAIAVAASSIILVLGTVVGVLAFTML